MSALGLLADWRREPPAGDFAGVFAALDGHGHDGRDVVRLPWAVLGHQHFWTTPEELGERQPLEDPASGVTLALDGRIDNREEVASQLGLASGELAGLSDAALVLRAWVRWGEECFAHLLGPFAAVVLDTRAERVVCARDPLGDRTLCYHSRPGLLVAATEPIALLAHPAVSDAIDPATVARFFAIEAPAEGATFFADVRELPPAHVLVADRDATRLRRYWQPDQSQPSPCRSDDEWVEHFHDLLADSVSCRLRTLRPPTVLMSGGLDSTAVAALAARELGALDPGTRLRTVSWVFDEIPEADERAYITAMIERFDLDATLVSSDDGWPLIDGVDLGLDPNLPARDVFHRLTARAYAAARADGGRTQLSGHFGDQLYSAWPYWLRDLLTSGRPLEAMRLLRSELNGHPLRNLARPGPLRTAVAFTLGRHRRRHLPPWLTDEGRILATVSDPEDAGPHRHRDAPALRPVLDPLWASAASLQSAAAARQGVDTRFPYRDRRLVEAVLAMDSHLLHRSGQSKWILRQAGRDLLPEAVRRRTWVSSMAPLFIRGVADQEFPAFQDVIWSEEAAWPRFVRSEWVGGATPARLAAGGTEALVLWNCVGLELWRSRARGHHLDIDEPNHVGSQPAGDRSP